jgi:hypothetical protein
VLAWVKLEGLFTSYETKNIKFRIFQKWEEKFFFQSFPSFHFWKQKKFHFVRVFSNKFWQELLPEREVLTSRHDTQHNDTQFNDIQHNNK